MDSWEQNLSVKTTQAIIEILNNLETQIPVVRSRARVIGTPAEDVIFGELKAERQRLRGLYQKITATRHSNIVAAELANLQGREKQVEYMIEGWSYAKEVDKTLDRRIEICKKVLNERREQEQDRRIGDE